MAEPSPHQEELRALRVAAEQRDWNGCRAASEKLLLRLSCRRALLLTRVQVMRRLPVFERHQPAVRWPREFIESIEGDASHIERSWPEAEDDFASPGANSFTSAVEALWKASRLSENEQRCATELVNALSSAIMAESTEHWGSHHPEEWALWYQLALSGESDPRMTTIQINMVRDPEVMKLERSAWLNVAAQLESALHQG
jgi:hypothetical protein